MDAYVRTDAAREASRRKKNEYKRRALAAEGELRAKTKKLDELAEEVARLRERQEDADLVNEAIRWKRRALEAEKTVQGVQHALEAPSA